MRGDKTTLMQVMKGGLSTDIARQAASTVDQILNKGQARYQLVRTDHRQGWVGAEVVYRYPQGQTGTIYWVVVKDGPVWKVDPQATQDQISMPSAGQRRVVGFNTPR